MEFFVNFLIYAAKYIVSVILAYVAIRCGIALRKKKDSKAENV